MTLFESKQHVEQLFVKTRALATDLIDQIPQYAGRHNIWEQVLIEDLNYQQIYEMAQTVANTILTEQHYQLIMLANSKMQLQELTLLLIRQIDLLKKIRDKFVRDVAKHKRLAALH